MSIARALCSRAGSGANSEAYSKHSMVLQACTVLFCLLLDVLLSLLFIVIALLLLSGSQNVGDLVVKFVAGYFLGAIPTMATRACLLPDEEVAARMTEYLATDDTQGAFYNVDIKTSTFEKLTDI